MQQACRNFERFHHESLPSSHRRRGVGAPSKKMLTLQSLPKFWHHEFQCSAVELRAIPFRVDQERTSSLFVSVRLSESQHEELVGRDERVRLAALMQSKYSTQQTCVPFCSGSQTQIAFPA